MHNIFLPNTFMDTTFFCTQNFFGPKFLLDPNFLDPNYFSDLIQVWTRIFNICLNQKKMLTRNYFGPTIFEPKIFCGPTIGFSPRLKIWQVPACNVSLNQLVSPSVALLAKHVLSILQIRCKMSSLTYWSLLNCLVTSKIYFHG